MSVFTRGDRRLVCDQEGCQIATGGPCLEGFSNPEECPHVQDAVEPAPITDGDVAEPAEDVQEAVVDERASLYAGEPLTSQEALDITLRSRAHVVVVAGPADSGKTTLLTSLYEMFQGGEFAGFRFAGSRTLPAFERRCHLARLASGRADADTERTNPAERDALLHLRLQPTVGGAARELLLTDLPGEVFRLVRDSTEEAARFGLFRRADRVVVLLDSARFIDAGLRQEAATDARLLLRSALDAGVLDDGVHIDLVVSKLDILEGAPKDARQFTESAIEQIRNQIESRVNSVRVVEIAARPRVGSSLQFGQGVDALLPRWLEDRRSFGQMIEYDPGTLARREFESFLRRVLPRDSG
jgi:hypothetical protein